MEKGESWYGLFDTMVDSKTEVCLSLACFFSFSCFFCPSKPKFLWDVSIIITFVEKEDDECMCV